MMNHFINGFLITASLIMAIGAQNAFVLKQGLLRQHIKLIILLCWLCDFVLISIGVFGISALLSEHSYFSAGLSFVGAVFLCVYGGMSAKRAYQGGHYLTVDTQNTTPPSAAKITFTTLAFTLLNPHVYIDAVILIGGSAAHLDISGKIFFLLGSLMASGFWFISLGLGARLLLPLFRREQVWQILDALIAIIMFYLAYTLFRQALPIFNA